MRERSWPAVPNHQLGLTTQDWLDDFCYVLGAILIVGVGIDYDVGSQPKARVKPGHVSVSQSPVAYNSQDPVHTHTTRDLTRAIRAAVIDDEYLDTGDTRDAVRQIRNRRREVLALVKAGDLDD